MGDLTWFKFRSRWIKAFKALSKPEIDRLFDAIDAVNNDTEPPEMVGREALVWSLIGSELEDDKKARRKAAEAHKEAGKTGGRPKTILDKGEPNETKMDNEKPKWFSENQNKPNCTELRVKSKELREQSTEKEGEIITPAPKKATKHKHGNFQHVLLTDDEYRKLQERFLDVEERIQKLDNYLENNRRKHYDNHYLTILTWARKDAEEQKPKRMTFDDLANEYSGNPRKDYDIDL